jgi:hypothetical protein
MFEITATIAKELAIAIAAGFACYVGTIILFGALVFGYPFLVAAIFKRKNVTRGKKKS